MKFELYLNEGYVIDIKGKLAQKFANKLIKDVSAGFDTQNKAEVEAKTELEKLKKSLKYMYSSVKIVGFKDIHDMASFLVESNLFLSSSWGRIYNSLVGVDKKKADFILEKGPDFIKTADTILKKFDGFAAKWIEKRKNKEYYAPVSALDSVGYERHRLYNDIETVKEFIRRVKK
ncbi:MAG: hypothetical protein WC503_02985 [Candidatus Shapirobacteria bacterium]